MQSAHSSEIITLDIVLLTMRGQTLYVGLRERDLEPFKGQLALVGDYVNEASGPDADACARNILEQQLQLSPRHLEQVLTQVGPDRDPRGWSASVLYMALHDAQTMQGLANRGLIQLRPLVDVIAWYPRLAFDHGKLITLAVKRLRERANYSTITGHLLPDEFTITELQDATEALLTKTINKANFRRKVLDLNILEEAGRKSSCGRPAQTYRLQSGGENGLTFFWRGLA